MPAQSFRYLIDKAMQKGLNLKLKAITSKEFRNVFFELIAKIMNLFGLTRLVLATCKMYLSYLQK